MKRTEAGQGGKKGHSNMAHWDKTGPLKKRMRRLRRQMDKSAVREQR